MRARFSFLWLSAPRSEACSQGYFSASLTGQASVKRVSSSRLSVVYPFHVGVGTEYGWGVSQKSWRIDVEVDLSRGEVADWRLVEGYMPEDDPHVYEAEVGGCRVSEGNGTLSVVGPGIRTTVWTKTQVRWLRASDEHAVAVTSGGRVYVISVPPGASQ